MAEPPAGGAAPADLARAGREDARPPADELPAALLGGDGLLVPLARWGLPQQLFWPHPDRDANLAELSIHLGAAADGAPALHELAGGPTVDPDADIVTTRLTLDDVPDAVTVLAVLDPDAPAGTAVLLLDVTLAPALGPRPLELTLTATPGGTPRGVSTHVEDGTLVARRRDRVVVLAAAPHGEHDGPHGGRTGGVRIDPAGPQASGGPVTVHVPSGTGATVAVALAADPAAAGDAAAATLVRGTATVTAARRAADRAAASGRTPTCADVDGDVDVLDRIGLRVLRALQDPGGGVLAAPECDPDRRRSGGYGFVWARDLAFILLAAAVAGRRDVVDGALGWLVDAQSADGLYEQRHWSDGTVGPVWGLQLDETGAVLHALGTVAGLLDDPAVVDRIWPTVVRAADALATLLDPDTGLPPASLDAWEERVGVHTYTVAATIGGLEAAATLADGRDAAAATRWRSTADRCRTGLTTRLWSEEHGRFLRSRDVARDDDAGAPVPPRHQPVGRPTHPVRSVDPVDATVDASLLGLAYPFTVLPPDDPRLVATIDAVATTLRRGPGLLRYPDDPYVGGNPWLLTRLWLGLARRAPGATGPADGLADVAACATGAGLLAEQVDADTGRPVWVVPLAWTHAFLTLACRPDHRPAPPA